MHELSIATALVSELERLLDREGGRRVHLVKVVIGALAGIEGESLRFCFPLAAEGSRAAGAILELEQHPLKVYCEACGWDSLFKSDNLSCINCGSTQLKLQGDAQLFIKSVEIEKCVEPVAAAEKTAE